MKKERNLLVRYYSSFYEYLFTIYTNIPFLFELRSIMVKFLIFNLIILY